MPTMIARLTGVLSEKSSESVIVDVGGVGYRVLVSQICLKELPDKGNKVQLDIHTHVREDQISLFGFANSQEKLIFTRLINVSGVGPKMALTILSGMNANRIVDLVIKEDIASLTAIQGVGRKTAERIIIDLKDRLIKEFAGGAAITPSCRPLYNDAVSALVNLGYPKPVVDKALAKVDIASHTSLQTLLRQALRTLGK